MGKSKALIQLIFALILSLAAGVLLFQWMRARSVSGEGAAPRSVMVAVAAGNLTKGLCLGPESVKLVPYLPPSLPEGYFSDAKLLQGRMPAVDLVKNEPITASRLLSKDLASSAVSARITPGKRALAVKGNKVLGLSGFIRPGSRVDVLVTIEDSSQKKAKSRTKIVLENIRVLATGEELDRSGSDKDLSPVDTYTLEVTPAQSERLALAATRGTLHFALRNPADNEPVTTVGASVPTTLAALRPVSKESGRPAARTTVEVVRGSEKKRVRF
ncbi:MAG: Flp pilus assembly protein CpaB [Thermodesulfobacteriota bacterium]|nr:Flp pilus assembly protein CpaB [Thermodesulfobacteriota bacterium]